MSAPPSLLPLGPRTIMVTGSRGWDDDEAIDRELSRYVVTGDQLVHGGVDGADRLTEIWAGLYGVPTLVFKPDYKAHGARATHVRNDAILEIADQVVAFWDGKSPGTRSVIEKAQKRGIPVDVIRG